MLADIGDEDEVEQPPADVQQQQQRPGKVQLSDFWPQATNAWFAAHHRREGAVNSPTLSVPWASTCCVRGWTWWKIRQQWTHAQHWWAFFSPISWRRCWRPPGACRCMVAGSNQRPSEVLASLLEFCPPGEEGTAFSGPPSRWGCQWPSRRTRPALIWPSFTALPLQKQQIFFFSRFRFCTYLSFRYNYDSYWI